MFLDPAQLLVRAQGSQVPCMGGMESVIVQCHKHHKTRLCVIEVCDMERNVHPGAKNVGFRAWSGWPKMAEAIMNISKL